MQPCKIVNDALIYNVTVLYFISKTLGETKELKVCWSANDRISIFVQGSSLNLDLKGAIESGDLFVGFRKHCFTFEGKPEGLVKVYTFKYCICQKLNSSSLHNNLRDNSKSILM